MEQRLHKLLARAGFAGRLKCEALIRQGHVSINGRVVRELGAKADLSRDRIEVLGEEVKLPKPAYFLFNKPVDVVSSTRDPEGRFTVTSFFRGVDVRLWPVGRLDTDSQGLLLMTNDGELAHRLTHPRYGLDKTYRVEVDGRVGPETGDKMVAGIWLSDGKARASSVRVLYSSRSRSVLEVVLREGRNRQIRRMLAKCGHKVRELTRVRMGPLTLGELKPGRFRALTDREVESLRRAAAEAEAKALAPVSARKSAITRSRLARPAPTRADKSPDRSNRSPRPTADATKAVKTVQPLASMTPTRKSKPGITILRRKPSV